MQPLSAITNQDQEIWQRFKESENLSDHQVDQFMHYATALVDHNSKMNITAITTLQDIINYHFKDSLTAGRTLPLKGTETVCDVGSGGGFPGIPLKIKYPHLAVILLEVNLKKVDFLKQCCALLSLTNIEVCSYDWRTLLRKAPYPVIDYFFARASLKPDELVRLFKPGYKYHKASLVYWASKEWQTDNQVAPYIKRIELYTIAHKKRQLIIMEPLT